MIDLRLNGIIELDKLKQAVGERPISFDMSAGAQGNVKKATDIFCMQLGNQ